MGEFLHDKTFHGTRDRSVLCLWQVANLRLSRFFSRINFEKRSITLCSFGCVPSSVLRETGGLRRTSRSNETVDGIINTKAVTEIIHTDFLHHRCVSQWSGNTLNRKWLKKMDGVTGNLQLIAIEAKGKISTCWLKIKFAMEMYYFGWWNFGGSS